MPATEDKLKLRHLSRPSFSSLDRYGRPDGLQSGRRDEVIAIAAFDPALLEQLAD
jgi:hypothetical protein